MKAYFIILFLIKISVLNFCFGSENTRSYIVLIGIEFETAGIDDQVEMINKIREILEPKYCYNPIYPYGYQNLFLDSVEKKRERVYILDRLLENEGSLKSLCLSRFVKNRKDLVREYEDRFCKLLEGVTTVLYKEVYFENAIYLGGIGVSSPVLIETEMRFTCEHLLELAGGVTSGAIRSKEYRFKAARREENQEVLEEEYISRNLCDDQTWISPGSAVVFELRQ
jgi:hypothetical protein